MNDYINTCEELIETVELQALNEYDECIDTLSITYKEYSLDKLNNELKELFIDAVNDCKILLGDYTEDEGLVLEAYEEIFDNIKSDL